MSSRHDSYSPMKDIDSFALAIANTAQMPANERGGLEGVSVRIEVKTQGVWGSGGYFISARFTHSTRGNRGQRRTIIGFNITYRNGGGICSDETASQQFIGELKGKIQSADDSLCIDDSRPGQLYAKC